MRKLFLTTSLLLSINTFAQDDLKTINDWSIDTEQGVLVNVSKDNPYVYLIIDSTSIRFNYLIPEKCNASEEKYRININNEISLNVNANKSYYADFCHIEENLATKQDFIDFETEIYYSNYKITVENNNYDLKGYEEAKQYLKHNKEQ